ncbi:MAG: 50S ribosomal protein L25/general stress protein Ctc [Actinomycetales bacterium]|nr:50S ribosomal protein L25/general stress protein Ctc [Actinomycetales bacterium]
MSEIKLPAERRTAFGKGAARRIRRDNKIPAVLYAHGSDPIHITLPGHATMMALKTANVLLSIELEGNSQLALAKDVQRDPIKPVIEHVDLVMVKKGEKVVVDVPVVIEGEAQSDTVVTLERQTLQLEVEATKIPASVVVSVEDAEVGTMIHAGDIALPEGATLIDEADILIVNVSPQISQEELDADLEGGDEAPAVVFAPEPDDAE